MNAVKQAIWFFCALVALSCSALYFASSVPGTKLDDKTLSMSADTIVTNLTVRRFDLAGKVVNYLQSPEMQHIPHNNTHFFKSPQIAVSQGDQPAWEISAAQAQALNGGEEIIFIHDVIIHQSRSNHTQESTLKTEKLSYFPKDKLASTQSAVQLEQPGTIVHSQGMKAYLADKRVQLTQARATYKPDNA
ncbi:LPS export ABC transporter periplasmic protein LptC [Legionella fairfieldensis]|uniref:LPS export ABC transporter periplasmic protein LptC n=1 Tax=Legionella fairfieldensis TaxID=45064 RepID=UPI00048FDBFF|nr:LPS export ABC transporter periplasmic protein LptC [Legionella fairfieldensis]